MLRKIIKTFACLSTSEQNDNSSEDTSKRAVPLKPRHDDLYLVSYPKSGATWLDFLIANINVLMSGGSEEINVFNVHDFVPDIHYANNIENIRTRFPSYRIIKSHDNYNSNYKKIIYLLRDPRDVMISYYHFSYGLGEFSGSISEFIRSPRVGIDGWCEHLKGWFEESPVSTRIYFMRYEDMKNDTYGTLNTMYKILGHLIPEEILYRAIELSSFSKMKESEKAWNYGGRPSGKDLTFMRQGKSGTFKNELPDEDIKYINGKAGRFMTQFGYTFEK